MDFRAVIFVPALVASAICILVFVTFAAHYYLTILEGTAAGGKYVTWFNDSVFDNFWKPFYLAWLLCLWLGPAYVLGKWLAAKTGTLVFMLAVPLFVAWALYPISQLSSLSASSIWYPLHPQVFLRLAQKPAVTLGFFLLTLPLFAVAGVAFKWAFLTADEWQLLFVGAPILVLAGFLYARLLGRLAFALMFTRDLLKRKKKKKSKEDSNAIAEEEEDDELAMTQPSELPPINTPEGELAGYNVLIANDPPPRPRVVAEVAEDDESPTSTPKGELAGYNVLISDEPPPLRPRIQVEPVEETKPSPEKASRPDSAKRSSDPSRVWTDDDDDASPYGAIQSEVLPDEEHAPAKVIKPSAEEMELLEHLDKPKPPKAVWNAEVFAFLAQPGTISAFIMLCGLATLAGAAVRVARMFNPVTGENAVE